MLSPRNHLIIIDKDPRDEQLDDYFSKFDFQIDYYDNLAYLDKQGITATALLINWALLKDDPGQLQSLYNRFTLPIIIISNEANADMCVHMLEAGADDFLIKPLHPRELHARIGAISRRVQRSVKEREQDKEVIQFANWRLYPSSRQLFDNEQRELTLSAGEYDLLFAFVRQPQRVLGREFLLQVTKSSDLHPFDRRIDVQISRLRQKIETDARRPALIKTIRNGGYLFTSPVISTREISPD
ncbi:winged helix-turn-helix domain-containing protein [Legionella sp. CNM-4043-24]|uniref:winged helix-turn-helix domain-containing protein n=1 Tax=Legionella sp. CNM-4043-24 TaxID=3421646 RepID=UPI00403B102A